jgi:hypothetical protein
LLSKLIDAGAEINAAVELAPKAYSYQVRPLAESGEKVTPIEVAARHLYRNEDGNRGNDFHRTLSLIRILLDNNAVIPAGLVDSPYATGPIKIAFAKQQLRQISPSVSATTLLDREINVHALPNAAYVDFLVENGAIVSKAMLRLVQDNLRTKQDPDTHPEDGYEPFSVSVKFALAYAGTLPDPDSVAREATRILQSILSRYGSPQAGRIGVEVVNFLLKRGATIDEKFVNKFELMVSKLDRDRSANDIAENLHIALMKQRLARDPDYINSKDAVGDTPLARVLRSGQAYRQGRLVGFLIAQGAEINDEVFSMLEDVMKERWKLRPNEWSREASPGAFGECDLLFLWLNKKEIEKTYKAQRQARLTPRLAAGLGLDQDAVASQCVRNVVVRRITKKDVIAHGDMTDGTKRVILPAGEHQLSDIIKKSRSLRSAIECNRKGAFYYVEYKGHAAPVGVEIAGHTMSAISDGVIRDHQGEAVGRYLQISGPKEAARRLVVVLTARAIN